MDSLSLSDIINESTEFIPLMTSDDEVEINSTDLPEELAILPLRNTVIFPVVVAPITAGRDKSLRLIRSITEEPKYVGMIAQRLQRIDATEMMQKPCVAKMAPRHLHHSLADVAFKTLEVSPHKGTVCDVDVVLNGGF